MPHQDIYKYLSPLLFCHHDHPSSTATTTSLSRPQILSPMYKHGEREDTPSDISNLDDLPPPMPRRSSRGADDNAVLNATPSIRELDSPYSPEAQTSSTDPPFILQSSRKESGDWTVAQWLDAIGKGATMHTGRKERAGTYAKSKDVATVLDPNQGQCLLTRNLPGRSVQGCHMIAQEERDNDGLLTRLEYLWGLVYGHLNLDEPRNLMFIDATLHILLDANELALVPEKDIIDRFTKHKATDDIRALYNGQTVFKYRLLPLVENVQNINRLHRGCDQTTPAWKIKSTEYRYPFADLPILESHVEPHFVIMNTGQKLAKTVHRIQCVAGDRDRGATNFLGFETRNEAFVHLETIKALYTKWTEFPVPLSFTNGSMGKRGGRQRDRCKGDGINIQDKKVSKKRAAPSDFDRPGTLQGSNKAPKLKSESRVTRSSKRLRH